MAALSWSKVFKRTAAAVTVAFPDQADAMLAEVRRWQPPVVTEGDGERCSVCRRIFVTGDRYAYASRMQVGRGRVDLRQRQAAWPWYSGTMLVVVCDACLHHLAAWAALQPAAPGERAEGAAVLAGCVRALRQSSFERVEELVSALESFASAPRTFAVPEVIRFCAVCGEQPAPACRHARAGSVVLCEGCVGRLNGGGSATAQMASEDATAEAEQILDLLGRGNVHGALAFLQSAPGHDPFRLEALLALARNPDLPRYYDLMRPVRLLLQNAATALGEQAAAAELWLEAANLAGNDDPEMAFELAVRALRLEPESEPAADVLNRWLDAMHDLDAANRDDPIEGPRYIPPVADQALESLHTEAVSRPDAARAAARLQEILYRARR